MARRQKNQGIQMPEVVKKFLHILMMSILLGVGAWLFVALASYDRLDPSWNTSIDGPVHNLCGSLGAHTADPLVQAFGVASFLLPFLFLCWSASMVFSRPLSLWGLRLLSGLISLSVISFLASSWSPKAGGLLGLLLAQSAAPVVSLSSFWAYLGATLSFFVFFAYAGNARAKDLFIFSVIKNPFSGIKSALPESGSFKVSEGFSVTGFLSKMSAKKPQTTKERIEPVAQGQSYEPSFGTPPSVARVERAEHPVPESTPDEEKASGLRFFSNKKEEPAKKSTKSQTYDLAKTTHAYQLPSLEFLVQPVVDRSGDQSEQTLQENAQALSGVLDDYGVRGEITRVCPGPVVTLYELTPAPGVKSSRVTGLSDDIARSMCAASARVAVVPGKNALGIELPNAVRQTVYLREMMTGKIFDGSSAKLALALGKDIAGAPIIADLARMPHLLVAGTTGSGKSVAINTMILSLLYRLPPEKCRFIMIDPKMLELSVYNDIPHLLCPVVTEPKKAIYALKWAVREMEDRYRAMSRLGVRNIEGYNARLQEARKRGESLSRQVHTGFDPDSGKPIYETQPLHMTDLPYIVVIVDEMADLMMVAGKDIEMTVQRLAQMARAAGIHLIMATQRPSVDVITGTIKANFPTRISFQVTSRFDSRTILGEQGSEQLLGRGDMLFMEGGGRIQRVHGPFVSDEEVERVVNHLKEQGVPDYIENVTDESADTPLESFGDSEANKGDDLYQQAVAIVTREGKASTSFVQRQLQIGYNKAARIMEQMEAEGVVSPANHAGKREILVKTG